MPFAPDPGDLAVAVLAALLLAACAPAGDDPAPTQDLLLRTADRLLEEPGRVTADGELGFGPLDAGGWLSTPDPLPDGGHAVDSRAPVAALELPCVVREDRRLVLDFAGSVAEPGGEPLLVEVVLNGVALGTHALEPGPTEVRLEAPAAAWRLGPNRLELRASRTVRRGRRPDGTERADTAFSLRAVEWGPDRRVRRSGTGLVLPPATGLRYAVEGAGRLEVSGRLACAGAGTARVELALLDTLTGETLEVLHRALVDLDAGADGSFAVACERPLAGVPTLSVHWSPHADHPLRVERLEVRDGAGTPPPIVVVSVDTLAARRLALHGHSRPTSPALEAFARDAVTFERCRANAPWTVPSYLSQFSGLLPAACRVPEGSEGSDALWDRYLLAEPRHVLAECLRARGHATAAVVDNPWLRNLRGVEQGFEHFDAEPSRRNVLDTDWGMRLVFRRGLDWLDLPRERPPFLFLQVMDVHGPYRTAPSFEDRFGSRTGPQGALLPVVDNDDDRSGTVHRYVAESIWPRGERRPRVASERLAAAYDEAVAEFDAEFGRLLDELRARGLYDEAVVVVCADHGESLGENGWHFVHKYPFEQVLHVPLLVKLPGGRNGGARVATPVQLVDLYPTLAELAGVDLGERRLDGLSLVPLLEGGGEVDDAPWRARESVAQEGNFRSSSIVRDGWKLLRFDLRAMDPGEFLAYGPAFERWRRAEPELAARADALGVAPERVPGLLESADPHPEHVAWFADFDASRERLLRAGPDLFELYRVDHDPRERMDLAQERPDLVEALARALEEVEASGARLRVADSASPRPAADDLDHLRELGYLGAEGDGER